MNTASIISLIMYLAPAYGIDPYVATAVAYTESSMNPKAIGGKGEVGLFQIMPNLFKARGFTAAQMKVPMNNITVGLDMLREAKKNCIHKGALSSLVCYNVGARNAKKIKYPMKFKYVKSVTKKVLELMAEEDPI
jgi:soluble lytic murein transglycosylase-like protein